MRKTDIKTILLTWPEVSEAIMACVHSELGRHIDCEAQFTDDTYWGVQLLHDRMETKELCLLLTLTDFPIEDWRDTLPDDSTSASDFGILFSEHLLSRQLTLTWTHRIIAEERLWLVDVHDREIQEVRDRR